MFFVFSLLLVLFRASFFPVAQTSVIIRVPQDYPTIQEAVYAAAPGDIIQVSAGLYYENIVVTKSLTIEGQNKFTTIIDGNETNNVVNLVASGVTLTRLTIRNGGNYIGVQVDTSGGHKIIDNVISNNVYGIDLFEATTSNTIVGNTILDNAMIGINVAYSSSNNISNNYISQSTYGIKLDGTSQSNSIARNTISQTSYGIYVAYSPNNNIDQNNVSSKITGIYAVYSDYTKIRNNTVSGCAYGIQPYQSNRGTISGNTLSDNGYGIYLVYSGTNTLDSNLASNNDWGIGLYDSDGNTVTQNTASYNTYGFYVVSYSTGNVIAWNNIMNNTLQKYQDTTSGTNTWYKAISGVRYGNYWSNYLGQDTNNDGVGETLIPHAGVDYYPLINPWSTVHDIAIISVVPSKNKVYQGQIVNITVVARNEGTKTETFNVTTRYFGRTIGTKTVTNLARYKSTTLVFNWDTTGVPPGFNYEITAEASKVAGETDTVDNIFVDGTVLVETPATTLSVIPTSIVGPPPNIAETFAVSVTVSNVFNLWSWQVGMTFNPEVLEAVSFNEGPFLATGGPTIWEPATINNTLGIIEPHKCTLTSGSTPVSGSGTLASITFKVKNYGNSALHLGPDPPAQNVVLLDPINTPIPATLQDGYFELPWPPVASFTFSPLSPYAGETVTFNATASYDPDGYIVNYLWDFGDGTNGTGRIAPHIFADDGTYMVTLTVKDNEGFTDTTSADVIVLNRPPLAIFTESAETVPTGGLIYFNAAGSYDPDGAILSYFWDFGDGTNASGVLVNHAYADDGLYTVTLTVTDDDGATASSSAIKTISNRPPVAIFTESAETVNTQEVIYFNATQSYDSDGNIVTYFWDFGDGANATGITVQHAYADNGTYTVKLTVTDNDGATAFATSTKSVLNRPPVASFTESATTVPTGEAIMFNASASYDLDGYLVDYFWDFGDGTNAAGMIVYHSYTDNGTYTVTLKVTDNDGAFATASATKTVLNRAPVASFTESATTVQTGVLIYFNASTSYDPDGSIVSYFWDFGDGTNATGVMVSHAYADNGLYNVTLTVTDDDGAKASVSASKTILNRAPVASFTESATTVFTGEVITFNASSSYDPDGTIVSYFWTFGDGTNATGIIVTHAYAENGTFTVTLQVTDNDGATASASAAKTVQNRPPVALFTESATAVLTGEVIYFNASVSYDPDGSIVSFFWTFGDGINAFGVFVTHAYADNGVYTVSLTVTDNDGAIATVTATKTVYNRAPVASFTESATTVYPGEVITFNASASYDLDGSIVSYFWTFGDGTNATGMIVAHSYTDNGTYIVILTVTDNDHAAASRNATKTVLNRPPAASFTESATTVYTGEVIYFNASSSYDPDGSIVSYFWTFGDGTNATGAIIEHTYVDSGTFTVTLTVTDNDGTSASASATKTILNRLPAASFTESATTVYTGEAIRFDASGSYDPDGAIVVYFWDFGDGTNAIGVTVDHAYADDGAYIVALTVTDDDDATASTSAAKTVLNRSPAASFTESATIVLTGEVIHFNASSSYDPDGAIVSYFWDFGDGTNGTGAIVDHAYVDDGTYIVILTVTDDDGATDSTSANKTVSNRPPVANFTYSPPSPFISEPVTLNASTSYDPDGYIVSYFWDFGDGTNATSKTVTHAYAEVGTYNVILTVTDNDGVTDTTTAIVAVSYFIRDVAVVDVSLSDTEAYPTWTVPLNITVIVKNQGERTETFAVTVYYNMTAIGTQIVTLAQGADTTLIFRWNLSGVAEDVYTIRAEASVLFGETDIVDNTFIGGTIKLKHPGDANDDGIVNVYDLNILAKALGTSVGHPNYDRRADFNGDGKIDDYDVEILQLYWGP